jgi:hypothetical protein
MWIPIDLIMHFRASALQYNENLLQCIQAAADAGELLAVTSNKLPTPSKQPPYPGNLFLDRAIITRVPASMPNKAHLLAAAKLAVPADAAAAVPLDGTAAVAAPAPSFPLSLDDAAYRFQDVVDNRHQNALPPGYHQACTLRVVDYADVKGMVPVLVYKPDALFTAAVIVDDAVAQALPVFQSAGLPLDSFGSDAIADLADRSGATMRASINLAAPAADSSAPPGVLIITAITPIV